MTSCLYMDPPAHAVVLSLDEKSQIQALDRIQPGLPIKPGKCGTMTHDYKRNGTISLFAALNVLDGTVIGRCMQRQRHQEFISPAQAPLGRTHRQNRRRRGRYCGDRPRRGATPLDAGADGDTRQILLCASPVLGALRRRW